jgi:hypothetical protein
MSELNMRNECWSCTNNREVPGNAHIRCVKPDPAMVGSAHGIKKGWFYYPMLFDPTWKESMCANFENKVSVVSDSVSQVA